MFRAKQRAARASDDVYGRISQKWLQQTLEHFFPNAPKTRVRKATKEISESSEFVVSNDGSRTQHTCVDADRETITLSKKG